MYLKTVIIKMLEGDLKLSIFLKLPIFFLPFSIFKNTTLHSLSLLPPYPQSLFFLQILKKEIKCCKERWSAFYTHPIPVSPNDQDVMITLTLVYIFSTGARVHVCMQILWWLFLLNFCFVSLWNLHMYDIFWSLLFAFSITVSRFIYIDTHGFNPFILTAVQFCII